MNRVPIGSTIERIYYHVIPYEGAIYKIFEVDSFEEARAEAIRYFKNLQAPREADPEAYDDRMPLQRPWLVEHWVIRYPKDHRPWGYLDLPMERLELTDAVISAAGVF